MDENRDEEDFLTESATLSLITSSEKSGSTINTTWVIILEILLLVRQSTSICLHL